MTGIAIVGQGYMGRTHAEAWTELGFGDQILYINAPGERAWTDLAPKAEFTEDLDEVLFDPEVIAISVCTPTPSHADIAVRALSAGKHVLLEKPIALTLADASRIAAAAEKTDRVVMIAQVVRFFQGYASLLDVATSGEVGQVRAVRASRALAKPQWAPWWSDQAQSGGPLVDFSIHDFDQANLFLGVPVAVTATQSGTEGPYEITVEYRAGGVAQILSHPFLPQGSPFISSIDVAGTQGMASYRLVSGAPTDGSEGTDLSEITKTTPAGVTRIDVPDNRPYTQEVGYFLDCIRNGTRPTRSDVRSSIVALSVSLAARTSLETGGKVRLR